MITSVSDSGETSARAPAAAVLLLEPICIASAASASNCPVGQFFITGMTKPLIAALFPFDLLGIEGRIAVNTGPGTGKIHTASRTGTIAGTT